MFRFLALLCAFVAFANLGHGQMVEHYLAIMNGTNEVPPNDSIYKGRAILSFFPETNTMTFWITANIPVITNSHIHRAAIGINGGVVLLLERTNGIQRNYTNITMGSLTATDLRNRLYYVNLHTTRFPGGEIRGQLLSAPSCGNGRREAFDCVCDLGYTGMYCEMLRTCDPTSMNNANFPAGSAWLVVPGSCQPGYIGMPRMTCNPDGTWSNFNGSCTVACPETTGFNAQWPPTPAGIEGMGSCYMGWRGPSLRKCLSNGTWAESPRVYCQRITCPAVTLDNIAYPSSSVLRNVPGTCPESTIGNPPPYRYCFPNGTWGPEMGLCESPRNCDSKIEFFAEWPTGTAGQEYTGSCLPGFSGPTYRKCTANGTWASTPRVYCRRIYCTGFSTESITFPSSSSLRNITGTCALSYVPFPFPPVRYCDENGNWGSLSGGCTLLRDCQPVTVGPASWNLTPGRTDGVGACMSGWRGLPRRRCYANGEWASEIRYPCIPT